MERAMLSDKQWNKIELLLPGKKTDCGVTAKNNRLFVEVVLWVNRTGVPWRDLPERFGNWHRVYVRYNRWAHKGIWQQIFVAITEVADIEFIHVDGTIVKVHQHGAAKNEREEQGQGRSRGGLTRKIHAAVDATAIWCIFSLPRGSSQTSSKPLI